MAKGRKKMERTQVEKDIMDFLDGRKRPVTVYQISKNMRWATGSIGIALKRFVDNGIIVREGEGTRGRPYKYKMPVKEVPVTDEVQNEDIDDDTHEIFAEDIKHPSERPRYTLEDLIDRPKIPVNERLNKWLKCDLEELDHQLICVIKTFEFPEPTSRPDIGMEAYKYEWGNTVRAAMYVQVCIEEITQKLQAGRDVDDETVLKYLKEAYAVVSVLKKGTPQNIHERALSTIGRLMVVMDRDNIYAENILHRIGARPWRVSGSPYK